MEYCKFYKITQHQSINKRKKKRKKEKEMEEKEGGGEIRGRRRG